MRSVLRSWRFRAAVARSSRPRCRVSEWPPRRSGRQRANRRSRATAGDHAAGGNDKVRAYAGISIVDVQSGRTLAAVSTGPNPFTVALNRDGRTGCVSNWGGDTVSIVGFRTATVRRNLRVGNTSTARSGRVSEAATTRFPRRSTPT